MRRFLASAFLLLLAAPAAFAATGLESHPYTRLHPTPPASATREIRAVWEQSGKGLYPGDWPRTFRVLKANGITDLFVNVGGIDFAHYASKVLPRSMTCRTNGDQLAACLAAARGTGVRVHAWLFCFNATRPSAAQRAAFEKKGWYLKDPSGKKLTYLDPSNPDLRWTLLRAAEELARSYPVAGVHLDFVRWYERPAFAQATPEVWKRFRADRKSTSEKAFAEWRTAKISSFVTAARAKVKGARPSAWFTVAVLGKYPSCIESVGQDWKAWLNAGQVDYIVPMNYSADLAKYDSFIAVQSQSRVHARRTISGIGVTANGLHLTAWQVNRQIASARAAGLAGVAFFDFDEALLRLFPSIRR
jgi:uncharacterized lipoprotein YddW (UPF0748 family)